MEKEFFKLGIIGYPLSHSISPIIQTAALESVNLCGSYEKFEVSPDNLKEQIEFFVKNNFSGFNVTIPHKINILPFLSYIDPIAEKIGAVNTVKINSNGSLFGYNTDIYGFVKAIPENLRNGKSFKNAKILGCGGAALAVIFGLKELGCENLTISVRNQEKTTKLINELKSKLDINFLLEDINNQNSLENIDILVNTTPLGTKGSNENHMATTKDILKSANKNMLVYDLVYNPQETLLLKIAKELSLPNINGLNMLILQGAKAFEIWTEKKPCIQSMLNSYNN